MRASRGIPVPISVGALRNSKFKFFCNVASIVALRDNQSPYFCRSCGDFTVDLRCKVTLLWELYFGHTGAILCLKCYLNPFTADFTVTSVILTVNFFFLYKIYSVFE